MNNFTDSHTLSDQDASPRQGAEAGFSLVESLLALVLMLVVTGTVFSLVNPSTTASQTQPEVMDMQQRARVASDLLFRDLFMAGAGVYSGPATGALTKYFAPIIPRKMGLWGDAYNVVKSDAVTIAYIPNTYSQTTIRDPMPQPSAELKVEDMANCPKGEQLCGFYVGMTALIFDEMGHFDFFTITQVQDNAGHLQHRQQGPLSFAYQPGAIITQAAQHVYYYDAVNLQLRHYDGYQTDVPVVDDVVGVLFEYFGDPAPPTTPKPMLGTANCLYDAAGTYSAGLTTLPSQGGSLAELPLAMLGDGPWCGGSDNRFDADLLRVKKVRITLRMQSADAAFRAAGSDFAIAGRSSEALRNIPDYSVRFEVAPRNMNLGR